VAEITGPVDTLLSELPAPAILPPAPVAVVTDPVVALAHAAAADIAGTVGQPVTDTLPVDLPVEPISDLLAGAPPLITPVVTPIAGAVEVVNNVVPVADRAASAPGSPPAARPDGPALGTATPPLPSVLAATGARGTLSTHSRSSGSSSSGDSPASSPASPAGGGPAGDATRVLEALLPASPSGSGSGQSSGGPAASAAWLSSPFDYLPLTGLVPVSGPLQHVPSPVAIDPGSSPD
jgi:hypothetical protein